VSLSEQIESLWSGLIQFTSQFVIPDWGGLITLLPILLLLLVIGPIVSLVILVWLIYVVRRPRTSVLPPDPTARRAEIGSDGAPVFPAGEPYCYRDALIYPFGARRCDECGDELSVACPKCGVKRSAAVDACANCGLVLKVEPRAMTLRPAGPPPGGAAAA
jgi:hypothetical protein